jgi:5-methylcytosine-specific restriction enzyme subunit McrC
MSSAEGSQDVYGVLLDMAEVWELYLFHLLKDALADTEVVHAGRLPDAVYWLLSGEAGDRIAAMKPDILLSSFGGARRLILDAKYKVTTPGPGRREGVLREDLYQMAAYLSVATTPGGVLDGALAYPASQAVSSLEQRGPFRLARSDARFHFLGLACDETDDSVALNSAERAFVEQLRTALG